MSKTKLCVALDTNDLTQARRWCYELAPVVDYVKVGIEFFYTHGIKGYEGIGLHNIPIFLDLKLHDIPNTVVGALRSLMKLEPRPSIITVHALGGAEMMKRAATEVADKAILIAVTVLTSHDSADLPFSHIENIDHFAGKLAWNAMQAGVTGCVCGPSALKAVRHFTSANFLTVVPGIRPLAANADDQKNIATPIAAAQAGADILVIGRSVTQAKEPQVAAYEIMKALEAT